MAASTPASTTTRRPRVLLATARQLPDGEPGGAGLLAALDAVGVDARWVCWDDASVDWACDLVAVRSTWDYAERPAAFLEWARHVEQVSPLLNGADLFAWNLDKSYLLDLADLVPVVPTRLADAADLAMVLPAALAEHGSVVLKPGIGAGGRGLLVLDSADDPRLRELDGPDGPDGSGGGPWLVQPVVESIWTTGETSVFVLGGRAVAQVDKHPGGTGPGGEVRVHEQHGGRSAAVALAADTAALAERAVAAVATLRGRAPAYARVDVVRLGDQWVLGELELVEPGLYLTVEPANADRFAALVAGVLAP